MRFITWLRLAKAFTLPIAISVPVVWLFCWWRQVMLGNVVAVAVFLVASLFFSAAEFVEVDRLRMACMDGIKDACLAIALGPSDFVRVGAYGMVAFVQVMVLFLVSESIERRMRKADLDPSWRQ